ncbi:cytochrome P450 [Melanogaster broomeanus]|nr:cytochrome P450 [Melanogaster broomeanus]
MTLTATPPHFVGGALVFCIWLWLYTRHWWHLPPGIRGLQLLNLAFHEKPWLKLFEINRQYGDIASGSLLGNHVIIISSAKIAEDLLEKRSTNYSDRPRSIMCGELSGWGKTTLLLNYNDRLRQHRKWFSQEIGSYATVTKLHGMIELETRRYLRCILDDPGNAHEHVRKNFTSISLRLSHGYVTQEGNDPLVELARIANGQLSATTISRAYPVDLFPIMKYLPSWLPGAGFKREAKEYAAVVNDLVEIPHRYVKSRLAAGTALPSLGARLLGQPGLTEEQEDCVKWATATMYQGGADTAGSIGYAFYLAMTLYPLVMKKAQEELASVVGTSRLPTFADRPSLPYLEAVFTELLRWHNPAPLTIRSTRVDDEYNGYFIPAGSRVFVNIWAILHDERTYTNPLEFRPERFLGEHPEAHPEKACFGFGRRLAADELTPRCAGYFLAHSALWLTCAQVLAAFDISKCVENGVEITPQYTPVGGVLINQAPFKCSIRPRSSEAEGLIRQELAP